MTPNQVNHRNEQMLLNTVYNYKHLVSPSSKPVQHFDGILKNVKRRQARFQVGDYVRLSKYRKHFDKGYTPNWTAEIFKVRKVQYNTNPITYLLSDYENINVEGSIYAEEMQSVADPKVYLVDKVIREQKGKVLVKWYGFGPEHNSWIPKKELL